MDFFGCGEQGCRVDVDVALGGAWVDVSHGGGQDGEQGLNVLAVVLPPGQAFAGVVVPEVVQARRRLAVKSALVAQFPECTFGLLVAESFIRRAYEQGGGVPGSRME